MTDATATQTYDDIDDIAVWPNGTYATLEDVNRGDYDWMSDDYEIVRFDDEDRLRELGLDELLDDAPS